MTEMSKGGNLPLTAPLVRATLFWSGGDDVPAVDGSALLLQADGRVASDADFVFYNQPEHESAAVKHAGSQQGPICYDVIDIDLVGLPSTVQRIALAASCDGGTFGQVPGLRLVLSDLSNGADLASFAMSADNETAFVTGEVYRRDGGWRFRAVGQGYASGLGGLATDFGIDVGGDDTQLDHVEPAAGAAEPVVPTVTLPPPSFTSPPVPLLASAPPLAPALAPEPWPAAAPETPLPPAAAPPPPDQPPPSPTAPDHRHW